FDTILLIEAGVDASDQFLYNVQPVEQNDDEASTPGTRSSTASFATEQGTIYLVAVSGYVNQLSRSAGQLQLHWTTTPGASTLVDRTPPDTVIDSGPGPYASGPVTFRFSSPNPSAHFECRTTGAFQPCSSPFTLAPPSP